MKIGTRSVIYGAHQFVVHPLCLALAWRRLYGFPWQWQLWLCFAVHDLGYVGKPNMDGPEGETHPVLGARIVHAVTRSATWSRFCLFHSRHYSKLQGERHSRLCVADKLAFCITPRWFYLACVGATGELTEYMANGRRATCPPCTHREAWQLQSGLPAVWHRGLYSYMLRWVARQHRNEETPDHLESPRAHAASRS